MNKVVSLENADKIIRFGGKAANLAKMLQAGLPVPNGFAVGLEAFGEDRKLTDEAKAKIEKLLISEGLYAVRSSALAEDAEGASWAGQFETFLDTKPDDVLAKIEECHNSAKARAKAYASEKAQGTDFEVAVVVQAMIHPEYAGVLFTKDPVSGKEKLITEFVEGLGEELVSGRADPKQISWRLGDKVEAPFDTDGLAKLAQKVEQVFGMPQDIEWVWADDKIWLVQARPITVTQQIRAGYYLGEPSDLFYWGPSRTEPMYMSDWLIATERLFIEMTQDDSLPNPPKSLVLFCRHKMVYLGNSQDFFDYCQQTFEAYKQRSTLINDMQRWRELADSPTSLSGEVFTNTLLEAWYVAAMPEFSLYGAESSLAKMLERFDADTRQEIWVTFTVPDKPTFLAGIDSELAESRNPQALAKKYPWIQDGYHGVSSDALSYFEDRIKVIGDEVQLPQDHKAKRKGLAERLQLTDEEVQALTFARELAEFMDDRKAWMMQTRHLLKESVSSIEHGWFFNDGKAVSISQDDSEALWLRYVDFKASNSVVVGVVASNGGRHFINGEVYKVDSPTDPAPDDSILVVPSTSPSYVPLMRKARALVTDHGGMMSHAAIVAREFGLPCIVGTKQATKVLKDGDKVVLDLVKGEVNR